LGGKCWHQLATMPAVGFLSYLSAVGLTMSLVIPQYGWHPQWFKTTSTFLFHIFCLYCVFFILFT
jgi:hypothetical protein